MKKFILIIVVLTICLLEFGVSRATYVKAEELQPIITHAQDVWISALEWCESRGKPSAINPKDKDNTPSYYSFQFKPSTFRSYGQLYGVIKKDKTDKEIMELIKEHSLQRKIIENMINDKNVKWKIQFPSCIKQLGFPPRY